MSGVFHSCVRLDVPDNSSYIVFMPLFHVFGLIIASTNLLYLGAKVVLMSRFQPDLYLKLIQKHKVRNIVNHMELLKIVLTNPASDCQ